MGLFDIFSPLFSLFDSLLKAIFLPAVARLIIWGILGGAFSMWLYARLSSQKKMARIKEKLAEVQKALAKYQGNFEGAKDLIRQSLTLSWQQISIALKPAILASLPMLFLLVWIGNTYNYNLPESGSIIEVKTLPQQAQVQWSPPTPTEQETGLWNLSWPTANDKILLRDGNNQEVTTFPLTEPVRVLHKHQWWNLFFGNRGGYIPDNSALELLEIGIPQNQYLSFGPEWLKSAEVVFLLAVLICSLIIKMIFRIQ